MKALPVMALLGALFWAAGMTLLTYRAWEAYGLAHTSGPGLMHVATGSILLSAVAWQLDHETIAVVLLFPGFVAGMALYFKAREWLLNRRWFRR